MLILLSEVRPAKQDDKGDIGDEGRGSGSDGFRPLQPTRLDILSVGMSDEALMRSDEVKHGLMVAGSTGQDESAIALEMA